MKASPAADYVRNESWPAESILSRTYAQARDTSSEMKQKAGKHEVLGNRETKEISRIVNVVVPSRRNGWICGMRKLCLPWNFSKLIIIKTQLHEIDKASKIFRQILQPIV
jgi:hypothetical protein